MKQDKRKKDLRTNTIIHERCSLSKGTKCLDLSGIKLRFIPDCVLCLHPTLRHLYLHNCSLMDDFPLRLSDSLQTLDLSQNSISLLPEAFCMTAKRLTVLDLSYNNLTRIAGGVGELCSLRELNLAHNKIIYIPSEVGSLSHLEELDLNSNCILGLPSAVFQIGHCSSLRVLDLSNNQISEIPDTISNIRTLTSINISNNKLKYLPATCRHLGLLEALHYGGNIWYERTYNTTNGRAYGTRALIILAALSL